MAKTYDVIVVGCGAMGSAALYQLSKTGAKVLGIDKFDPPHSEGSTHGNTRVTRRSLGEGECYVKLADRSHEIWREIEALVNEDLLFENGFLLYYNQDSDGSKHTGKEFFQLTVDIAKKHNISHEIIKSEELKSRFKGLKFGENDLGYYEHNGGYVMPEKCVKAQLELAKKNGADFHSNEELLSYKKISDDGFEIKTNKDSYHANKIIFTSGAWMPKILDKSITNLLSISREVLFWFDSPELESFSSPEFPSFGRIPDDKCEFLYGFPAIDGAKGGVKMATEVIKSTCTPDNVNREVSNTEKEKFYSDFKDYIAINNNCIKAKTCLYTNTPDFNFIIDFHPEDKNIIICSACSGHGFKHSAAIGEVLRDLSTKGETSYDISSFRLDRFK